MYFDLMNETLSRVSNDNDLADDEKRFVVSFAYLTGDKDITNKIIAELKNGRRDAEIIQRGYAMVADDIPIWAANVSELIVSIEIYRREEERILEKLKAELSKMGIDVPQINDTRVAEKVTAYKTDKIFLDKRQQRR